MAATIVALPWRRLRLGSCPTHSPSVLCRRRSRAVLCVPSYPSVSCMHSYQRRRPYWRSVPCSFPLPVDATYATHVPSNLPPLLAVVVKEPSAHAHHALSVVALADAAARHTAQFRSGIHVSSSIFVRLLHPTRVPHTSHQCQPCPGFTQRSTPAIRLDQARQAARRGRCISRGALKMFLFSHLAPFFLRPGFDHPNQLSARLGAKGGTGASRPPPPRELLDIAAPIAVHCFADRYPTLPMLVKFGPACAPWTLLILVQLAMMCQDLDNLHFAARAVVVIRPSVSSC